MGWLPQTVFETLRLNALKLSREERKSLTIEDACRFVAPDTLEMARFAGLCSRPDLTPWTVVCLIRNIDRAEGDPWGDH